MKRKSVLFVFVFALLVSFSYSQNENVDFALGLYLSSEFEIKVDQDEKKGDDLRDSSYRYVKRLPQDDRLNFYVTTFFFSRMLDAAYLGEWGNEISCNGDYNALIQKVNALLLQRMGEGSQKIFLNLKSFLEHRTGRCLTEEEMAL